MSRLIRSPAGSRVWDSSPPRRALPGSTQVSQSVLRSRANSSAAVGGDGSAGVSASAGSAGPGSAGSGPRRRGRCRLRRVGRGAARRPRSGWGRGGWWGVGRSGRCRRVGRTGRRRCPPATGWCHGRPGCRRDGPGQPVQQGFGQRGVLGGHIGGEPGQVVPQVAHRRAPPGCGPVRRVWRRRPGPGRPRSWRPGGPGRPGSGRVWRGPRSAAPPGRGAGGRGCGWFRRSPGPAPRRSGRLPSAGTCRAGRRGVPGPRRSAAAR